VYRRRYEKALLAEAQIVLGKQEIRSVERVYLSHCQNSARKLHTHAKLHWNRAIFCSSYGRPPFWILNILLYFGRVQQLTGLIGQFIWDRSAVGQLSSLSSRTKWQRLPADDTLRVWQQIPYYQCYLTYCWPTKICLDRSEPSTTHYKYLSIHKYLSYNHCKHDVTWPGARGSAFKMDPWKMARSFSRKLSNRWPVQINGSKRWTCELLDTLRVTSFKSAFCVSGTKFQQNRTSFRWDSD